MRDNLNNPVVSVAEFANDIGTGWSFLEPLPTTKQRPPSPSLRIPRNLLQQAGQLIADTFKKIDQGMVQASKTVGQGMDLAGRALNDFSNFINNTTGTILRDNPPPELQQILRGLYRGESRQSISKALLGLGIRNSLPG